MWFAAFVGCAAELFTFSVTESTDTLIEAVDAPEGDVDLMSLPPFVDADGLGLQALEEAGVDASALSQLTITALSVEIVDPEGATFEFLDAVEIWVSADGLDDVQVAAKDPVPGEVASFDLDVNGVDLAPYLFADGLTVSTFGGGHLPTEDTVVRATATVEIGVTAQGVWSQVTGR